MFFFFFSSRRRHTRCYRDWSSDVCSSDLRGPCRRAYLRHVEGPQRRARGASARGGSRRSEERRVGKECRSRGSPDHLKKKKKDLGVCGVNVDNHHAYLVVTDTKLIS